MMLTKEDPLESEPFNVLPVSDARVEDRHRYLRRDVFSEVARCVQELEGQ